MAATRWTGRGDGTHWADPANWSAGLPSAGIDAAFGTGPARAVTLGGPNHPLTAGALVAQGDTLSLAFGELDLKPKPAVTGNTFDLVLTQGADLTVAATARLYGSNVTKVVGATLTVLGLVSEDYALTLGGTLDISGPHGHWVMGDSGLSCSDSTLRVEAGAHIDAGGKLAQYPAAALDLEGNSTGLVTGAGSTVRVANTFVSEQNGTSTLTVQDGGRVLSGGGTIGGNGDGTLTVTGAGSQFVAFRGLTVGGQAPVNSKLVIADGGTVKIGPYGLQLAGTLALDASATLTTPTILSRGGTIDAVSGDVRVSSRLQLSNNDSAPFETKTAYLEAAPGATLILDGAITSAIPKDTSDTLEAASGHIVLGHSNGSFGGPVAIYGATLEIAAAGAAGTGGLDFIGGSTPATLLIDDGLAFRNLIGGFGKADTIDLSGFSFGDGGLTEKWTPSATGGTLTLANADHQHQLLSFAGADLSAASFGVMSDGHGGTALTRS